MPPPRTILVCVDGSDDAIRAADAAGELAAAVAGRVIVLAVVGLPKSLLDVVDHEAVEVALAGAVSDMTRAAVAAAATHGVEVTVEHRRASGSAGRAIVDAAAELRADLIVVGRHGSGQVARTILGSVSGRVVAGAQCPVLVIPPQG